MCHNGGVESLSPYIIIYAQKNQCCLRDRMERSCQFELKLKVGHLSIFIFNTHFLTVTLHYVFSVFLLLLTNIDICNVYNILALLDRYYIPPISCGRLLMYIYIHYMHIYIYIYT